MVENIILENVARLCGLGLSDREVAEELGVKKWRVRYIRRKLGIKSGWVRDISFPLCPGAVLIDSFSVGGVTYLKVFDGKYYYNVPRAMASKFKSNTGYLDYDSIVKIIENQFSDTPIKVISYHREPNNYKILRVFNTDTQQYWEGIISTIKKIDVNKILRITEKPIRMIEKVKKVLGEDDYDFSKTTYTGITNKSTVTCKKHGDFKIDWSNTLHKGTGCPKCGDERKGVLNSKHRFLSDDACKDATLYLVRMSNESEVFYKFGLTTRNIVDRLRPISGYIVRILRQDTSSPDVLWDKEKQIKSIIKGFEYKPIKDFDGKTECFSYDMLENVLKVFDK